MASRPIEGEADAVVGDAALGKIVGADALAAVAGAHLGPALLGDLALLLLLLQVKQPGLEDLQGLGLVFVLGFFILAGDHEPRGQVGDAHRRVRGVHDLAPGPGGAVDVERAALRG